MFNSYQLVGDLILSCNVKIYQLLFVILYIARNLLKDYSYTICYPNYECLFIKVGIRN